MNNHLKTRLHSIKTSLEAIWQKYWLLRWTVSNMVGWSLALLATLVLLQWFGIWGAIPGGAIAGAISAYAQSRVLHQIKSWTGLRSRWILHSAIGGALATIPVYILGFVALFHIQIGLAMMGAMFGGITGLLQYRVLSDDYDDEAIWWVIASLFGGMLCAPLTVTTGLFLPIISSLGPVIFGLITGWAIITMNRSVME